MSHSRIEFMLNTPFSAKGHVISGTQTVEYKDGTILWNGNAYSELSFLPDTPLNEASLPFKVSPLASTSTGNVSSINLPWCALLQGS